MVHVNNKIQIAPPKLTPKISIIKVQQWDNKIKRKFKEIIGLVYGIETVINKQEHSSVPEFPYILFPGLLSLENMFYLIEGGMEPNKTPLLCTPPSHPPTLAHEGP